MNVDHIETETKDIQATRYLKLLSDIMKYGSIIKPRGEEVIELENTLLEIDPQFPFMTFEDRNYSIDYFKKEMRWKLGANKYDRSIEDHAKKWKDVRNPDGTFNSNYGQYWFGDQGGIWKVVLELIRDQDSRQAVIPMLNASHMSNHVVDKVCTESVGFRIRPSKWHPKNHSLNMTVHMRSSDVIFGLGTDIPTFAFLYRLVYGMIYGLTEKYIDPYGTITIAAMSSHIYDRHYPMVNKILARGPESYQANDMPWTSRPEALKIIASRGKNLDHYYTEESGLGAWLCD